MTKYLISCECGNTLPIDTGQAGEQVTCRCGAKVDVPPLRKLRHLPVATQPPEAPAAAWNTRRGIIAACLILAIVPTLWALGSRLTEPYIGEFDPGVRQQSVEEDLERMSPVQTWNLWVDRYRPMAEHGFTELEHPQAAAVDEYVGKQRFLQRTLLVVAGVFAAVAVIAAIWPNKSPTSRHR